jgi:hypothetical protein
MCRKIIYISSIFIWGLSVFFAKPVLGQFWVTSTSPVHGSANVDTAVTFSITFNSAIDTSARFQFPEGFFVNIYLYPDSLIGEPDSITLSPDLSTVYVHNLHLFDNTTYYFVIVDAVSIAGDSLEIPHPILFTTAASLPSATVSGTLSYPGNDPTGTWVILSNDNPFGSDGGEIVNGIIIPNNTGMYTIDLVEVGTYWPLAIQNFNIDQDGEIEIYPGSAFGFYDNNGDNIPDSLIVPDGSQISEIDFSLNTILPHTARDLFPQVQSAAQGWSSDADLVQLFGELEPDGSSLFWQYLFYSRSLMDYQVWHSIGDILIQETLGEVLEDTITIPTNWLDSDSIMTIAEIHGGGEFRQNYPDAEIMGSLRYLNFNENNNIYRSGIIKASTGKVNLLSDEKFVAQNRNWLYSSPTDYLDISLPASWVIQYYSFANNEQLMLLIEAGSGVVLNEMTTAASAELQALLVAQSWAPDSKLWGIYSHQSTVDSIGRAEMWMYIYYSSSLDSLHAVAVWGRLPIFEGPTGWTAPDTTILPSGWLDSDVAVAVAENQGGTAYRNSNQDVFVEASLLHWFQGPNPDLTIWRLVYTSSTTGTLEFLVNALTGTIVGISDQKPTLVLDKFTLHQNYPNPFNPITAIEFELPKTSEVTLKIFNILGQEVATLVSGKLSTGTYTYDWNASHLASGAYLYRLSVGSLTGEAGEYVKTRKMILIK